MSTYRAVDFLEIYHTDSTVEAGRILEVVLRPQGVEGVLHDRMDHAMPAPTAQPGEVAIAVPADQRDQALEILKEAVENGVVSGGEILE
jgi:hypothetical protein